ncbi:MAG: HAD family hydrolase [Sphaerochaetaceae bacterium]
MNTLPAWIITDLDETLLLSDRTLTDRTLSALTAIRQLGVHFGIATTRSKGFAQILLDQLKPNLAVLSGGAMVLIDEKVVYRQSLDSQELHHLLTHLDQLGDVQAISIDTPQGRIGKYESYPIPFEQEVYSMFIWLSEPMNIEKAHLRYPNTVFTHLWEPNMYRASHIKATKDGALKYVLKDINPQDVLCFGDDLMDVGMLEHFNGVAVSNAHPKALNAATAITKSNNEEGVAHYLEHLLSFLA